MYKRVIPSILLRNGNAVKGINFNSWRQACDAESYAKSLSIKQADEISILSIGNVNLPSVLDRLNNISRNVRTPISYGGGLRSLSDIYALMQTGVDRFILNSLAFDDPSLCSSIISEFGSQAAVASIDIAYKDNLIYRYNAVSRKFAEIDLSSTCKYLLEIGFSEIIVTAINCDGTQSGMANHLLSCFDDLCFKNRILFSGGIGIPEHIICPLSHHSVSGVLIGSSLIYTRYTLSDFHSVVSASFKLRSLYHV